MFVNLQSAYAELARTRFELERRADEIEAAHDLFKQVIESMSEALFLIDCSGRVIQANPAARVLLACSEAELVGRSLTEVCGTPEIPSTVQQLIERSPGGTIHQLEITVRTRSNQLIPVSVSCTVVRDRDGKILGMLVIAQDITRRKQVEEALARQAQELARSNAELEQFAYVASHDLQEPLRMMASFAQLLAQEYRGRLGAEADEYIAYIVDGATRMQRLINDLLSYARVGTHGKPFTLLDTTAIVATACTNLRAAIEESGAVITCTQLPAVRGDTTQLVQLFQNLIGNAIKFRADRPLRVDIGAERQGDRWRFWVRDNGIGIEPQYAERVFLIFQRLHSRADYPGTGIGLALCKKIVERHGGRIWIESEPERGCSVYFTLPAHDQGAL